MLSSVADNILHHSRESLRGIITREIFIFIYCMLDKDSINILCASFELSKLFDLNMQI